MKDTSHCHIYAPAVQLLLHSFSDNLDLTGAHKFRGAFRVQTNKEVGGYNPCNSSRSNLKGVLVFIHRAKPDQLESQVSGWLLHTSDQQCTPTHL